MKIESSNISSTGDSDLVVNLKSQLDNEIKKNEQLQTIIQDMELENN